MPSRIGNRGLCIAMAMLSTTQEIDTAGHAVTGKPAGS